MLNNVALDVVIGLIFIYLLYSLLGTLIQEIIATNIGLRGIILEKAIKRMLNDDNSSVNKLSNAFYNHPLVKFLADGSWPLNKKPSYLDPETFSKVVIDLLRGQNVLPGSSDRTAIQSSLDSKKLAWDPNVSIDPQTLIYLRSIWADAQGDVVKFKANLEQWFNEMMDRTTGWYKKYTQLILLFVGLGIAISFNVDTIKVIKKLQSDPQLREKVIAQANEFTKTHPNLDKELADKKIAIESLNNIPNKEKDSLKIAIDAQYSKSKTLRDSLYSQAVTLVGSDVKKVNGLLAFGWDGGFYNNFDSTSIPGWLLTALAISLGAPFWFDLLNKLMQLRGSIASANDDSNIKATDNSKQANRVG